MHNLLNVFAMLTLIFIVMQNNKAKAGISTLEKNDEHNSIVTIALFEKLNWMIMEMKRVSQQVTKHRERQNYQNNINSFHLNAFKSEIRELLQQQDIKTENLMGQLQQEIIKNFDLQEKLMKNTSASVESMKLFDVSSFKANRNWRTILRRQDGSQNFNRSWHEYKTGFGEEKGEFFIGLEALHALTTYNDPQELLIVLQDFDNQTRYAKYSDFVVGSESEKYEIKKIGKYQGDANDSLTQHLHCKFSTYDQDNDNTTGINCSKKFSGGWWFCQCLASNLAGEYYPDSIGVPWYMNSFVKLLVAESKGYGIIWESWRGFKYSLKYAEMKIRPK